MIAALATALVHFLWQGVVLGLIALAMRPGLRRGGASFRYVALYGLLLAAPAVVVATIVRLLDQAPAGIGFGPSVATLTWAHGVAAAWAAGVAALGLQTTVEFVHLLRLRATGLPLREWLPQLQRLRQRMGITTHVAVCESPAVDAPLVTGWIRPMILMPIGITTGMPAAWVEAILAHELAHVRRHDVLLGVVQRGVEMLLFFHPVVWWLSAEVRRAREEACDDVVVDALQSPLDYARALTELASLSTPPSALAMGARTGDLMSRIQHIVRRSPRPLRPRRRAHALPIALVVGAALGVACLAHSDTEPVEPEEVERKATPETDDAELATPADPETSDGLSIAWLPDSVTDFEPEIVAAARRHGVDPNLVAILVLVESRGEPAARSPVGARGLMQVMPKTAEQIAAERGIADHTEERLDDPEYNLDLGAWYLAQQLDSFDDGDVDSTVEKAAAAYNAGPKRMKAAMRGDAELSDETQRYREIVRTLWAERDRPSSSLLTP